jgi:hypothetical protein
VSLRTRLSRRWHSRSLSKFLKQMASANAVSIAPLRKELTTYEAADLLNVSRPFVIGPAGKRRNSFPQGRYASKDPLSALL